MNKRQVTIIATICSLIVACPFGALKAGDISRIGLLDAGAPTPARISSWRGFESKLRDFGYVEGKNIAYERRWGRGNKDRLNRLAQDLVNRDVDIIVTVATPAVIAASRATKKIPIVTAVAGSIIVPTLIKTLARPGGNVTGLVSFSHILTAKRLELAKEILPSATRMAILGARNHPSFGRAVRATTQAANVLDVSLLTVGVSTGDELGQAFATMKREGIDAFVVPPSAVMGSLRKQLATLAEKARLPAILPDRRYAKAGGLLGFGSNLPELFKGSAVFVHKILKGAKPSELPAEQQTRFDLVINLKTAEALGITFPPAVLLRATEVIE